MKLKTQPIKFKQRTFQAILHPAAIQFFHHNPARPADSDLSSSLPPMNKRSSILSFHSLTPLIAFDL
jgi:hypothetical protein